MELEIEREGGWESDGIRDRERVDGRVMELEIERRWMGE